MHVQLGSVGEVGSIFDSIKSVVGTIVKGAKVINQGVTATVQLPGLPPVMIDLTDPNALAKAKAYASNVVRNISISPGRPPSVADQVASAAGSFLSSPAGLAVIGIGAFMLLSRGRR